MPCKRVSIPLRATMVNLEGIRLPGLFEKKGWYIWVPFLEPEDTEVLTLGVTWNFGKGTGLC